MRKKHNPNKQGVLSGAVSPKKTETVDAFEKPRGEKITGPQKGEFVPPPEVVDTDERTDALPAQEDFWRPPVRFGSVPVEKEPLGWDRRRGFRKLFPLVSLPTQVVERVSFGHPSLEPNRLFWGDNLHVMRQLPSESIDLIYIDPPFFSGRNYNVIFGDQNELRSFSDIWEGGMPGYLIWLNARLYEMKRLLKKTGTIYVHCDWHASHHIKVEMDKIFGYANFLNEVIVHYSAVGLKAKSKKFHQNTEPLLSYAKMRYSHTWNDVIIPAALRRASKHVFNPITKKAERVRNSEGNIEYFDIAEQKADNFIEVAALRGSEKIGYPPP